MKAARWLRMGIVGLSLAVGANTFASTITDAMTRASDYLTAEQLGDGSWSGESDFTGSMVTGLAKAYQILNVADYKLAAEEAGAYILASHSSYLGEELYSLTRLSEISGNSASNSWRTAVGNWYSHLNASPGGTQAVIDDLRGHQTDTDFVLDVARNTVAAYYVNSTDKALWRSSLITGLSKITDADRYPVGSLGMAVWALAQTGAMDNTLVDSSAASSSIWFGKTLADLPGMLVNQQVSEGEAFAGGFTWLFNGTASEAGYTEDTVWGTLGLIAAYENNPTQWNFADQIHLAREALAYGVLSDGSVYDHIWNDGVNFYVYGGETLEVLPEPTTLIFLCVTGVTMLVRRRRA